MNGYHPMSFSDGWGGADDAGPELNNLRSSEVN